MNTTGAMQGTTGAADWGLTPAALEDVALPQHPSAWLGHVPFAQWLVGVQRPDRLVELGTHHGHSYFAFCRAVVAHGLATRCHAIDSWEGDAHAGEYGEEIFAAVDARNRADFAGFSTLHRQRFDDAREAFADGSIDLLHIDGLHTYEAVRHDFETWRPKLSRRAVVLFHDSRVHERGFGVWRLWSEIAGAFPSFEFGHSYGLGVLLVGPQQPDALLRLAGTSGAQDGAAVAGLFAALGARYQLGSDLAQARRDVAGLQAALAAERAQRAEIAQRRDELAARVQADEAEVSRMRAAVASLEAAVRSLTHDREALLASTSWRLTAPLRGAVRQTARTRAALKLAPAAMRLAGGAPNLARAAWRVARAEGVPGVLHRLRYVASRGTAPADGPFAPRDPAARFLRSTAVRPHDDPVDIVVCVHNAPDDVRRCLESVAAHTRPPYRLIVVDDGSAEPTATLLREFMVGQPGQLLRHAQALGYTLAANAGLRASRAPFVVLLNSDTIVSPLWIDRLVECAQSSERIGLVGPLSNTASWQSVPAVFDADGDWSLNPLPAGLSVADQAARVARVATRSYPRVGFLNGFCLLLKRELLDAIGLFDEAGFGRGFGEENDFAVRARLAGWQLAVADDAYVFHAQSRSYSDERRRELAVLADRTLRAKHPSEAIDGGLELTRFSRHLEAIRCRVAQAAALEAADAAIGRRHEGRRVLFVLPVADSGGGANVVIAEALAMQAAGIVVGLANLASHRSVFERNYPALELPVIYLDAPADLAKHVAGFDAVVATVFFTVDWVRDALRLAAAGASGPSGATAASVSTAPVAGYYIQDCEPLFFEPGSVDHRRALASYHVEGFRLFCKTAWNAEEVSRLGVPRPQVIGPSFQYELFMPGERVRQARPVRIGAMVRPSTPRRAPQLTVDVLAEVAERFGDAVRIVVVGVGAGDPMLAPLAATTNVELRGHVSPPQMGVLLASLDVFADLSTYQAMGLTAMEAMASGVAVVGPMRGGLGEIVEDGRSGLLVDTQDPRACVAAIARLVEDWELRDAIARRALAVVAQHHPQGAALRLLDVLFGDAAAGPAAGNQG